MNSPIYMTPPTPLVLPEPQLGVAELTELLRQSVELQRDQLAILRAQQAAQSSQDVNSRWRSFLTRWAGDFPTVGSSCKQVLPILERTYLALIEEVTSRIQELGNELEGDFVLNEFLDRYASRLTQLGNIVSQISPIADAAPPDTSACPDPST